jgi:hypothetical protein
MVSTESEEFPLLLFSVIEIELPLTEDQFLADPFGLAVAPQVFTRVFQTVIAHLHTLSVQAHIRDFFQEIRKPRSRRSLINRQV